jgi:phosphoserine phosphatase RsbU/P
MRVREYELSLAGDLRAELDPVRLSQVVSNLVSNAIQYGTPDAKVEIRATGTPQEIRIAVHNLQVLSNAEEGTTFTVRLPR